MSSHGIFQVPEPHNEPVLGYEPGSPERDELRRRLDELSSHRLEIPLVIGGKDVTTGDTFEAVMPHKRSHVLADVNKGGAAEVDRHRPERHLLAGEVRLQHLHDFRHEASISA